jgi:hypothetical protein
VRATTRLCSGAALWLSRRIRASDTSYNVFWVFVFVLLTFATVFFNATSFATLVQAVQLLSGLQAI